MTLNTSSTQTIHDERTEYTLDQIDKLIEELSARMEICTPEEKISIQKEIDGHKEQRAWIIYASQVSAWKTPDIEALLSMSTAALEWYWYERTRTWVRKKVDALIQLDISPIWILSQAGLMKEWKLDIDKLNDSLPHLGEHILVADSWKIQEINGIDGWDAFQIEWRDVYGNMIDIEFSIWYDLKDKSVGENGFIENFCGHDTSIIESVWMVHARTYLHKKLSETDMEDEEDLRERVEKAEVFHIGNEYFINWYEANEELY